MQERSRLKETGGFFFSSGCHQSWDRHGASAFYAGAFANSNRKYSAGVGRTQVFDAISEYDEKIGDFGDKFGLKVDPSAKIWQFSVGEQQRVEFLKMLYRGVSVLIMDEPTAVLAPQEIEGLFVTLRAMVAEGKSIIFISHKLQEVTAISDRLTVLRRGVSTASGLSSTGVTRQELARLMVGTGSDLHIEKEP